MGEVYQHRPVMLIAAVISRFEEAFGWTRNKSIDCWGEIEIESPRFDFVETGFYRETMGESLQKQFFAYTNLIDPEKIASAKITANAWEREFADEAQWPVKRPLNIDPGYITEAKLVLATTKDRDHRIYLQQGIFAEVTLHYHDRQWRGDRWTYPDYQRADFQEFFSECRRLLRQKYRGH
jgi:hypothetical protein